jgi:hypothetical protein
MAILSQVRCACVGLGLSSSCMRIPLTIMAPLEARNRVRSTLPEARRWVNCPTSGATARRAHADALRPRQPGPNGPTGANPDCMSGLRAGSAGRICGLGLLARLVPWTLSEVPLRWLDRKSACESEACVPGSPSAQGTRKALGFGGGRGCSGAPFRRHSAGRVVRPQPSDPVLPGGGLRRVRPIASQRRSNRSDALRSCANVICDGVAVRKPLGDSALPWEPMASAATGKHSIGVLQRLPVLSMPGACRRAGGPGHPLAPFAQHAACRDLDRGGILRCANLC